MNKILVISPHFDDAVLSAGQFIADRPDADVVTVFAGLPLTPDNVLTPYDEKCGFESARDAVGERTRENDNALALLNAVPINLDFPDSQYDTGLANSVHVDHIVEALQNIVDENHYEFIMAPLGLSHPDHIKVTDAVIRLKTKCPIYLWEDMPVRVVDPLVVIPRLALFGLTPNKFWNTGITDKNMAKKIRALTCYKSQIGTGILDPYLMYVPERFWKYRDI
jgi:LmbE family N-acetylglucosaminyl deacetylase